MTRSRTTAPPAPLSIFAVTPNPIPSILEPERTLDVEARRRLGNQRSEEFINRIMTHKSTIPDRIKRPRYTIPVRYPSQTEIVRTAPESKLRATGWPVVADPSSGEVYLISPCFLTHEIWNMCLPIGFALAVSDKGASFLWPYLANCNAKFSGEKAVKEATDHWVRVKIDKAAGEYHLERQTGNFPKPSWPRLEHDDVINIVFVEREIYSPDDPVLNRLRGEADA